VSTQFDFEQPVHVTGGWRVLAPFRFREYRLLIGALSISIFAEGMWAVVMAMQVIALDNDPASLSLVATCLGTGLVAFVLVGGIAADRIDQRTIIIAVETVNVAVVLTVAVLSSLGVLRVWHMAAAAGTLGIAAAFFFPAYSAMLPRILPADQLLAANGVEGVVRPVFERAVGPAVAGMLVGVTFPALGAFVVAALFAVGLVLLVATRPAKTVARSGITSARTCCGTCATGSASWCAHRGCCGRCCSRASLYWWCSARSRCCCRSSRRTASKTARGCTGSSWRPSGSAARSARWRCRRAGYHVAT
jgi:DHA3 family tetracycline resistance protein-like MFS transporter